MGRDHNRLIFEKSPYLLQHAHNPVDWYPWGQEAFSKAQKEDKPVFLSIGYSTCHWCHVMAHESFEDMEVAREMNETFVSIKVDREERPDIDNIYMRVCQIMTGSGGWPLTIIMTPDKKPFFAATYIPKAARFGQIGMLELIPRIKEFWATNRGQAMRLADEVTAALQKSSASTPGRELDKSVLELAYQELAQRFDEQHGGFGSQPKFPTPHNLLFLLRYWRRTGDEKALGMVKKTLQAMRYGGIYDHIGFGFHRYSTDAHWLVPHFEKMLYDQAMLAMAYTEAYQATRESEYQETAREIFTYVLRDMQAPEGGFFSAEDADSEGEEGKFYLWTEREIREVLKGEEAELIINVFNVARNGNFISEATKQRSGTNILHLRQTLTESARIRQLSEAELRKRLNEARQKLFVARNRRIHPHKDDKILTDWNGLMIAALAKGGQAFDEPKYANAARSAADFILRNMRKGNGRLWHRYRDGLAGVDANLDDYAFFIWGLIELYEATFAVHYLREATTLTNDMIEHFGDGEHAGFYFTPDDGETMLVRNKEIYDGAIPSGNAVAMLNLLRLGRMTANSKLEQVAAGIGRAFFDQVTRMPSAHLYLMVALDFGIGPSYEVTIAGNSRAKDTKAMLRAVRTHFVPNKVVLHRPAEPAAAEIIRLAAFTKDQTSLSGKATAYVCLNYSCQLPTTDLNEMLQQLNIEKPMTSSQHPLH